MRIFITRDYLRVVHIYSTNQLQLKRSMHAIHPLHELDIKCMEYQDYYICMWV